ncbi:MAG: DUF2203 domain-containing protein [Chloroflexi bacterium]|nr:DUF2203 domain-containing protein [Chloroflexota bacterium]
MSPEERIAELERLNAWLQEQLERQRQLNGELRRAVADLARTFQESLAAAYAAGESGDIDAVRRITRANQANWQAYLQQIIAAASKAPPPAE